MSIISNLTTSELLRLLQNSRSLIMDAVSHKICLINRKDRANVHSSVILSPITSSIKSRLAIHFRTLERGEQTRLYKYLSKVPGSRATAGIFFEAAARGCFRGGVTLELLPKWCVVPRASVKAVLGGIQAMFSFITRHWKQLVNRLYKGDNGLTFCSAGPLKNTRTTGHPP